MIYVPVKNFTSREQCFFYTIWTNSNDEVEVQSRKYDVSAFFFCVLPFFLIFLFVVIFGIIVAFVSPYREIILLEKQYLVGFDKLKVDISHFNESFTFFFNKHTSIEYISDTLIFFSTHEIKTQLNVTIPHTIEATKKRIIIGEISIQNVTVEFFWFHSENNKYLTFTIHFYKSMLMNIRL